MKKLLALMSLSLILAGCTSTPKEEVATPTPEATATPGETTGNEGTTGGETVTMTEFQTAVDSVVNGGTYEFPSFMTINDETLSSVYGLTPEDVENYAIYVPMMNVQATEIIVVEAKDGKLDAVKEALAKRMTSLEDTWSTYLPDQYELVQNRVEFEDGNLVGIVIAENADQIAKDIQTAVMPKK
ncbi:DUF4358 domain-containing protein [Anaerorhabdus sp.]|jgi:hypothetical protein|uniref:DUF4358 domain-containing protein n=1 Tax=Anaerorhabdus sp. TaxID=1872524 RepID=UPI002FC9230F